MISHEAVVPPEESDNLSPDELLTLMFQVFANDMIIEAECAIRWSEANRPDGKCPLSALS